MGQRPPTPDSQRTAEPTAQGFWGFDKKIKCGSQKRNMGKLMGLKEEIISIFKVFPWMQIWIGGEKAK